MINTVKNWVQKCTKKLSIKFAVKLLGSLFLVYLLLGYFAVNPLAKKLLPSIAEKSLASKASVGSVKFDPLRLKATIEDFRLTEVNGKPLFGFKRLIVDLELSGMFDLAWKFKQISVAAPKVNVAIAPGGQLNWHALLNKLSEGESEPSNTIPRLIIQHIIVNKGKVQYADADRPIPLNTTLSPLGFQLKGFSTLPKDRGDYLISAAFADNGGSLKWKGNMGVNPVVSKGVMSLEGVSIAEALALVKGLELPIKLNAGEVQTSFNYHFALPKTIPTLALTNLNFSLSDVAADLADGGSLALSHVVLSAPRLDFVNSKQATLQLKDLDFKLTDLSVSQPNIMQFTLKESTANLPQLDFSNQEKPQLTFQDLNLQLADLNVENGEQFSLALPTVDINAVGLDLADNKISIKEVVLADIDFNEGVVQAEEKQNSKPLATLKQIIMSGGVVALADQNVIVESLVFSGLETSIIKNADQSLNWLKVFEPKQQDSNTIPVEETTKVAGSDGVDNENATWIVMLQQVVLEGANIHIQDKSVSTPVVMDIEKASVEIENASLDLSKPLPIKAAFNVKQGGRFTAKGQLWPSPLKAKLGLRLSRLSLKPFAPYVNQVALLKLSDGTASVSGKLDLKQQENLALTFNGRFGVKRFALLEEADDAPFLSWDDLSSNNLRLSLMPNKLHMATLQIAKPSGKFIINEDKSMNVTRILRAQSAEAETLNLQQEVEVPMPQQEMSSSDSLIQAVAAPQQAELTTKEDLVVEPNAISDPVKADAFPVRIDTIRLSNAQLEFADLSLRPQFGTNIHSLNGVINGLSTKAAEVSQVEMDGKVDTYGAARIRGSLQPFSATNFTDIKLAFTNIDMSRLTPYSGKFAGRRIDSGKLSVDLQYKVKQHQLAGENKFVINKLKLGEKVDSAEAADLPLDLAIAILEDSDGVIDLDLPISGSLDDPKFSYGSIFWKAIRNVLTKIVTAPFRALGSIFGGGAEDFDGIAFEAGNSEISPPELEKLVKVSTALSKRQGLSLGIVPSYHVALDTQAIKEATYRTQVSEEMGLELADGQKPGPVDLGNEKVKDAIDVLHNKLTKKGFFKRMKSKFEEPEEGHYEKAQASLIASIEVAESTLQSLAEARGKTIQAALLNQNVSEDRLKVMGVVEVKSAKDLVKTELTLDVKKSAASTDDAAATEPVQTEPISSGPVESAETVDLEKM